MKRLCKMDNDGRISKMGHRFHAPYDFVESRVMINGEWRHRHTLYGINKRTDTNFTPHNITVSEQEYHFGWEFGADFN